MLFISWLTVFLGNNTIPEKHILSVQNKLEAYRNKGQT